MKKLTYKQVKKDLLDIIKEVSEDYVYQTGPEGECNYYRNGEPSCLIGHVIDRHPEAVVGAVGEECMVRIGPLVSKDKVRATAKASELMTLVQYKQDSGLPWHQSVKYSIASCEGAK